MNKKEFLNDLEKRLKYVSEEDRKDAMEFYNEYLCDMGVSDDEDVTSRIGKPKEIAAGILTDCTEKMISDKKEDKSKNGGKIVLLVLLIIFSVPILIPLAVCLIIVLLTILFTAIVFVACGILSACAVLFANGIGQKLICLGFALFLLALGILLIIGVYELGRLSIRLIIKISKKNGKKENNNEESN